MPGVAGRSGRPRKPVDEHLLRGTYRADRHGDRGALALVSSSPSVAPRHDREARRLIRGLSRGSQRLGRALLAEYEGWATADLVLLRLTLEALDRAEACRKVIAADGLMPAGKRADSSGSPEEGGSAASATTNERNRGGHGKPHPLLRVERQAMTFAAHALARLNLEGGK